MTEAFVDTDVIIRLLTGDDAIKQQAAAHLFEQVERGEIRLHAPDTVIADAVYVLCSPRLYDCARSDVADMLAALLRVSNFALENKAEVLRALDVFAHSTLDFGDALIIASMQHSAITTLYSFDHDFDQIEGLTRVERAA